MGNKLLKLNIKREDMTLNILNNLLGIHKYKLMPRYIKLDKYYNNEHEIEKRPNKEFGANNIIENDYAGYITDVNIGYFLGQCVNYSDIINSDMLEKVIEVLDANGEDNENILLAKECSIKGECFELVYLDENAQIRFDAIDPQEMLMVYDNKIKCEPLLAIRIYEDIDVVDNTKITNVVIYWKDYIDYYNNANGSYELINSEEHYFGDVPVIHYMNNDNRTGDYEKVISLIDDYDKRTSDSSNELEDFKNAYLKIINMSGTTGQDIQEAKEKGAFLVDGDGDVGFITKDTNTQQSDSHISLLDKNIHKFAKVPNLGDESFAGNLSGVAIQYKLWGLEQNAITKERKFKEALYRRLKLIIAILNKKGNSGEERDFDIAFNRNMPNNLSELVDMISKLNGIVSNKTLLTQLPFVDDADAEMAQKEEESTSLNFTNNKIVNNFTDMTNEGEQDSTNLEE